jgi:hypothetical protein
MFLVVLLLILEQLLIYQTYLLLLRYKIYFFTFSRIYFLFKRAIESKNDRITMKKYASGQVFTLVICSGFGVGSFFGIGVSSIIGVSCHSQDI